MWIFQKGCDDKILKECMERFLNATCTFQLLRLKGYATPFLCMFEPGSMEDWETGTLRCVYSGTTHKSVVQMQMEDPVPHGLCLASTSLHIAKPKYIEVGYGNRTECKQY